MRCAFCHDESAPGDMIVCTGCGTRLHQACWQLARRCTTLGCAGSARKPRLRRWLDALLAPIYSLGVEWSGAVDLSSSAYLVSLAWSRFEASDLDGALAAASRAVALDRAPDAYLVRAFLRRTRREWQDALPDTGELVRLAPEFAYGFLLRAEVLEQLGDEAGADEVLDRVKSLCAEGAGQGQALEYLAWAHLQTWDFAKALEILEQHRPSLALAHARRGVGDLTGALRSLDECMLERPHDVATIRSRAFDRCLGGDLEGAYDDAEAAVKYERWRGSGWALLTRAFVRALRDDRSGAVDDLREAQRHAPRFQHLALWRAGLGDDEVDRPDADELPAWPARLVQTVFERADPAVLLAAARSVPGRRAPITAQQETYWIQGLFAEQVDRRSDAIRSYQRVVELGDTTWLQYTWSFARLRQWGMKPEHRAPRTSASTAVVSPP